MKKLTPTGVIAAVLAAVTAGSCGYAAFRYFTADTDLVTGTIPIDEYYQNQNTNVKLERPGNWRQIASVKLLKENEFAGIDGSTATIPITAELARQFCGVTDYNIEGFVSHNKTDAAYENLIFGNMNSIKASGNQYTDTVRLLFATPPSEDEYRSAQKNNVTLDIEPVALDGFVFIVNKDNPVDSLTVRQIQDIYQGKITNWKEVGGNDEKIRAFQRSRNSGSQTAMEEMVMKGKPLAEAPVVFISEEMSQLVDAVAEYNNEASAIGYTYYYYINNLFKNEDIKVLNVEGISPENKNLVSGDYPFTASYYAVIRSDEPENSVYRKLRDYMLTDEGQEIVRLAGYCPIKG